MIYNFIVLFVAGMSVGVALEKFVFAKMRASVIQSRTDALHACFGEPMIATTLTFAEVTDWVQSRREQLVGNAKAAVVKVNEKTMKNLGKDLDTKGVENYIILVIMNEDKRLTDTLLVKYEKLDQRLENAIAKGNGILVITG